MPGGVPQIAAIRSRAASENFPVALRVLPAHVRADLFAVYDFARLVDDIGDDYQGDRLAALDWVEHDLEAAAEGGGSHPAIAALTPFLRRHAVPLDPFRDLIEANRRDQYQHRYATFDDLLDYCRLSANPIGRLVLAVFGVRDPAAAALSDDVCSGLQVVEHLQDVREDLAAGRIYLPTDDLATFGCTESDLGANTANEAVRRLVAHECGRARALLSSGQSLAARLARRPRLAIAGFVAGGRAALDAIERAGFDVLGTPCPPSRRRLARHAVPLFIAPGRRASAQARHGVAPC